jgi:large subunit ribosomal protein L21
MFSRVSSLFSTFSSSVSDISQFHRSPLSLTFVRHEIRPAAPPPQVKLAEFQRRSAARRAFLLQQALAPVPAPLFVTHQNYQNPFANEVKKAEETVAARNKAGVYGQLYRQSVIEAGVELTDLTANTPLPVPFFAIFSSRGFQYKVTEDDLLMIPRYPAEVGQKILFNNVLLLGSPSFTLIGRPRIQNAIIEASVEEQIRTQKVLVFHKKRRKGHRKFRGHRSEVTMLRIQKIIFPPEYQSQAEKVMDLVRRQQMNKVKKAIKRKIEASKQSANEENNENNQNKEAQSQ